MPCVDIGVVTTTRKRVRGASLVEYALVLFAIVVAGAAAFRHFGVRVSTAATQAAQCLSGGDCTSGAAGAEGGSLAAAAGAARAPESESLSPTARAILAGMEAAAAERASGTQRGTLVASNDPSIGASAPREVDPFTRVVQQSRVQGANAEIDRVFRQSIRPGGTRPGRVEIVPTEADLRRREVELDTDRTMIAWRERMRNLDERRSSGAISAEEYSSQRQALMLGQDDEAGVRARIQAQLATNQQESIGRGELEGFVRDGTVYVHGTTSEHAVVHETVHTRAHPGYRAWLGSREGAGELDEALTERFARQVTGSLRPNEALYGNLPDRLQPHVQSLGGERALRDCYFGGNCGAVDRALASRRDSSAGFMQRFGASGGDGHRH